MALNLFAKCSEVCYSREEAWKEGGCHKGRLASSQGSRSLMKFPQSTHWSSAWQVQEIDLACAYPEMKVPFLTAWRLITKHIGGRCINQRLVYLSSNGADALCSGHALSPSIPVWNALPPAPPEDDYPGSIDSTKAGRWS